MSGLEALSSLPLRHTKQTASARGSKKANCVTGPPRNTTKGDEHLAPW